MNAPFEEIKKIPRLIAAGFLTPDEKLRGWCANNHFTEENLRYIGATCLAIIQATREEQRSAHTGTAAFGDNSLVFRESVQGLFFAFLATPVNDAVREWLFTQVIPILQIDGIDLNQQQS